MLKNSLLILTILLSFLSVEAQVGTAGVAAKTKTSSIKSKDKNKISLDFEDELVKGVSDAPDVMFLNTRKSIKYNELYDLRTNFVQEIELNRGLFNDFEK